MSGEERLKHSGPAILTGSPSGMPAVGWQAITRSEVMVKEVAFISFLFCLNFLRRVLSSSFAGGRLTWHQSKNSEVVVSPSSSAKDFQAGLVVES